MAIGWISVLKLVPWGEVIDNAPKVADAAKKLWKTVGRSPQQTATPIDIPMAAGSDQERLRAAEIRIEELHAQMLASSELIKALADQNTQLVKRAETNRLKTRRLAAVTVLTLILAITSLCLVLAR